MKREERAILIIDKESNGIGEIQARKEIKELEESQKQFRILYNEKNKLERDNQIIQKELKKAKEENFQLKFKLDKAKKEEKSDKLSDATNHHNHIIRIIRNMEIGKEYGKTELHDLLCIGSVKFNECFGLIDKCKQFNYEITKEGKYKRTQ